MDIINEILEHNNWSVAELASNVGVKRDTVYKWLRHEARPKVDTAYKLLTLCKEPHSLDEILKKNPN